MSLEKKLKEYWRKEAEWREVANMEKGNEK